MQIEALQMAFSPSNLPRCKALLIIFSVLTILFIWPIPRTLVWLTKLFAGWEATRKPQDQSSVCGQQHQKSQKRPRVRLDPQATYDPRNKAMGLEKSPGGGDFGRGLLVPLLTLQLLLQLQEAGFHLGQEAFLAGLARTFQVEDPASQLFVLGEESPQSISRGTWQPRSQKTGQPQAGDSTRTPAPCPKL